MKADHRPTQTELLQVARECAIKTLAMVKRSLSQARSFLAQHSSPALCLGWCRFVSAPRRLPWMLLAAIVFLLFKSACAPQANVKPPIEHQRQQTSPGTGANAEVIGDAQDVQQAGGRPPAGQHQHTTEAPLRAHQVSKPIIEATDPLTRLIVEREELDNAVEQFVRRLIAKLPPRDAAYVSTIYRTHSPGQCLVELDDWSSGFGSAPRLESADRLALRQLLRRWRAWELELARQGSMH